MKTRVLMLAAIAALTPGPAAAQQVKPGCTDRSRACLERAAESYYRAMETHTGSRAWLHPNVRRTLTGLPPGGQETHTMEGEAVIRASLDRAPPQTHKDVRLWVDEKAGEVIAFLLTSLHQRKETIHVAERFKVEKGLITEIEAIIFRDPDDKGVTGWEKR